MAKKSDAAVGRLAVMDGVLNELLRELVTETTGQDAKDLTTGKAAQALLGHAKRDSALLTPDVTDWLRRAAATRPGLSTRTSPSIGPLVPSPPCRPNSGT